MSGEKCTHSCSACSCIQIHIIMQSGCPLCVRRQFQLRYLEKRNFPFFYIHVYMCMAYIQIYMCVLACVWAHVRVHVCVYRDPRLTSGSEPLLYSLSRIFQLNPELSSVARLTSSLLRGFPSLILSVIWALELQVGCHTHLALPGL